MSTILRIVLAILAGVLTTGLLDYFDIFTHGLNVIFGIIVALIVYFNFNNVR